MSNWRTVRNREKVGVPSCNPWIAVLDWKLAERRNIVKLDLFDWFWFSSSNGCHISGASWDRKWNIWTVEPGSTVEEFSVKEMPFLISNHENLPSISPDGRLIALGDHISNYSARPMDKKSGSVINLAEDGESFHKFAFHASGNKLIEWTTTRGIVRLWDLDEG
jgi:hypothetical protein